MGLAVCGIFAQHRAPPMLLALGLTHGRTAGAFAFAQLQEAEKPL